MAKEFKRNYGAMSDDKLMGCVYDFSTNSGDAVNRVINRDGDIETERARCEYEARKRGLTDDNYVPDGTLIKTPAKFCPSCERKKPFYIDDYICVSCREGIDGIDEMNESDGAEEFSTLSEEPLASDDLGAALQRALRENT